MPSKKQKWTPAVMCKRPDNLIASEYSTRPNKFVPSYEKDREDMWLLMAMEYARIWQKEKQEAKQVVLSAVDDDFLVRRYVKRGLLLKKKEEEKKKPFKMKKFEMVTSKIKIRTKEEIDKMMSKLSDQEKADLLKEAKTGIKYEEKNEPNEEGKADVKPETAKSETNKEEKPKSAVSEANQDGKPKSAVTEASQESKPKSAMTEASQGGEPKPVTSEARQVGKPKSAMSELNKEMTDGAAKI